MLWHIVCNFGSESNSHRIELYSKSVNSMHIVCSLECVTIRDVNETRGGGGDSPARRPGADGRCASLVVLPHTLPLAVLGAPPPAMLIVPQAAMKSCHWPGTAPGPAGDRPPPHRLSNSNHADKSMCSGKVESLDRDPGIATLVPGMRFPGN